MSRYTPAGDVWEGMLDYYLRLPEGPSQPDQYLTVDPNSNPMLYYVSWVVSDFWANAPNNFSQVSIRMVMDQGQVSYNQLSLVRETVKTVIRQSH